ncbi:hypothetical protein [Burkholderia plantarii]|uniref:hypothetical protein n=1 Tax=Burkholderia plantarii TaxID=41899 RepID=UPI0018DC1729|nr:hypothetical protein [Burkholderia plantarii]MBI0331328.1 hypothetical protein [Burkholderia plantarii]
MAPIASVPGREVERFAEPRGVLKAALIDYGKTRSVRRARRHPRQHGVAGRDRARAARQVPGLPRGQPDGAHRAADEVALASVSLAGCTAGCTTGTTGADFLVDGRLVQRVPF